MFLFVLSCMMLFPMTAYSAPLPGEPAWDYISEKYPAGITINEASNEGIIQPLFLYFEGYGDENHTEEGK